MVIADIISTHLPAIGERIDSPAFILIRGDNRILHVSHESGTLLGIDPLSLVGREWASALKLQGASNENIFRALLADCLSENDSLLDVPIPFSVSRSCESLQFSFIPWRLHSGEFICAIGIKSYPEAANAQPANNLRTLALKALDRTTDLILIGEYRDAEMQAPVIVYANRTSREMLGYEPEELVGTSPYDTFLSPESDDGLLRSICDRIKKGDSVTEQIQYRRRDGSLFWVLATFHGVFNEEGKITGWVAVQRDITLRKRAELEAEIEKERMAVTIQSIADAVVTTHPSGVVNMLNTAAEKLLHTNQRDAIGRHINEFITLGDSTRDESTQNPLERAFETKLSIVVDEGVTMQTSDGDERIVAYSASPIIESGGKLLGGVLVIRDLTDSVRLERELQKIERIDSLSHLAAGMAHDYRNLLTLLLGNLSMAKHTVTENSELANYLESMEMALEHAEGLTKRLEFLSAGDQIELNPMDMITFCQKVTDFGLRGSGITFQLNAPEYTWEALADEALLSQVFNNLVINAKHAMPSGGELTIDISNQSGRAQLPLPLEEGQYVRISVQDTGIGIKPEHLDHIFDPYFTTKKQGTGLGLASAYNIVRRHGGHLAVESQQGKGTRFDIYLKATGRETADKTQTKSAASKPSTKNALNMRVLVVDDESMVRMIVSDMLGFLGCEAKSVEDGSEACIVYQEAIEAGEPFDAVLLDLSIPGGMGAKETIGPLLEIDANAKALLSTGHHFDPIAQKWKEEGFAGWVPKPYKLEDLRTILASL